MIVKSEQNKSEEVNEVKKESFAKSLAKNLLRIGISLIALICLLKFGKIDIKTALKYLLTVNPVYFSLGCFSYFIVLLISASRSYLASTVLGFKKTYFQLLQLNYIGTFFNNFLPTTFGGDAMRGYYLKKGSNLSLKKAAVCILYERYTGMIVLFWATSLAFVLRDSGLISKSSWNVPYQFALFAHAGTIVSIFVVPFFPELNKLLFGKSNWIHTKVIEPILVYWKDLKFTLKIITLSIILQIFVMISHYLIALSLNIDIPLSYYLVFYPLTTIAGFLIPSLNGLGVREGTYIYFLQKVNIPSDQALAFSICWLIILWLTSIVGGVIYMFGDFRDNKHKS